VKKFLIKWILIGLVLRLILMPLTIHPDIRALDFGAFLIIFLAWIELIPWLRFMALTFLFIRHWLI